MKNIPIELVTISLILIVGISLTSWMFGWFSDEIIVNDEFKQCIEQEGEFQVYWSNFSGGHYQISCEILDI